MVCTVNEDFSGGSGLRIHLPRQEWWVQPLCLEVPWSREWQLTLVILPGKSQGWGTWWAAVHGAAERVRHNLATEWQQSMVNEQVAFPFISQSSVSSIYLNQHPPPLLPPSFPSQLPTTTTAFPNPLHCLELYQSRGWTAPTPLKAPPAPNGQLSLITHHSSKGLFRVAYSLMQGTWQLAPVFLPGKSGGQNSLGEL